MAVTVRKGEVMVFLAVVGYLVVGVVLTFTVFRAEVSGPGSHPASNGALVFFWPVMLVVAAASRSRRR